MRNIKLTVEYDGTDFSGWQVQPEARTVQQTVEQSLQELLSESISLVSAARTDAGVHALGQVANFHTHSTLPPETIKVALNSLLPRDVVIRQAEEVEPEFHARFSADWKRYRYRIAKRKKAIGRHYCWYLRYELDVERMRQASSILAGTYDFTSFCSSNSETKTHICRVMECQWQEGEDIDFEIQADRFLQHMVRIIVGTMVEVGRGRLPVEEIGRILEAKDRRQAGPTAPAKGLCLVEVGY
ncbi:MAG: tRNA pseudouridine(38-40) synthase TruA [Candidatus Latescibacterota bacterium]|nr:MAG: tRNA pseudouridine(38-40) synthase TruA [Candidatus Latescibacterota bacterium]